jgi:hypothetical protein
MMVGGMPSRRPPCALDLYNFNFEPVLVGFKAGIAVVIIVDQLPKSLASTSQRVLS